MTTKDQNWVPVEGCTLPTIEQPLRLAEFDSLFTQTLTDAVRLSAAQARLTLVGTPGLVGRVQDLVDRESGCCSFFFFTLTLFNSATETHSAVGVHLDIAVPDDRTDVLAALVHLAETARDSKESA